MKAKVFLRIIARPWNGISKLQTKDTSMLISKLVFCMTMAKEFHRITPEPWNGISRQQTKDTSMLSSTLALCMRKAKKFRIILKPWN
ncbi:hypothetical protein BGZ59_004721, partial [Podila verticillata]